MVSRTQISRITSLASSLFSVSYTCQPTISQALAFQPPQSVPGRPHLNRPSITSALSFIVLPALQGPLAQRNHRTGSLLARYGSDRLGPQGHTCSRCWGRPSLLVLPQRVELFFRIGNAAASANAPFLRTISHSSFAGPCRPSGRRQAPPYGGPGDAWLGSRPERNRPSSSTWHQVGLQSSGWFAKWVNQGHF
jgi:hypothetical protein